MNRKWLQLVIFLIIDGFHSGGNSEVEAGVHKLVPFRSWVESAEKIEETSTPIADNEELAEYAEVRPKTQKHKETKKTAQTFNDIHVVKKKKKRRKRKKKPISNLRRFVKTANLDGEKDSNMVDSIEYTKKKKPVDIIVHIKVSE